MIRLVTLVGLGATVELVGTRVDTTFSAGRVTSNWPPADSSGFAECARLTGHGGDLMSYCFEHEVAHLLVPLLLFGERGYVSWMSANQRRMSLAAAKAEERLIYYIQVAARPENWTWAAGPLPQWVGPQPADPQWVSPAQALQWMRGGGRGAAQFGGHSVGAY